MKRILQQKYSRPLLEKDFVKKCYPEKTFLLLELDHPIPPQELNGPLRFLFTDLGLGPAHTFYKGDTKNNN